MTHLISVAQPNDHLIQLIPRKPQCTANEKLADKEASRPRGARTADNLSACINAFSATHRLSDIYETYCRPVCQEPWYLGSRTIRCDYRNSSFSALINRGLRNERSRFSVQEFDLDNGKEGYSATDYNSKFIRKKFAGINYIIKKFFSTPKINDISLTILRQKLSQFHTLNRANINF